MRSFFLHPIVTFFTRPLGHLKGSKDKINFYTHHASPLSHHPLGEIVDRPDFVAVKAVLAKSAGYAKSAGGPSSSTAVPWHHAESVGQWNEWNEDDDAQNSRPQSPAYPAYCNLARPDKPGVYALSASSDYYQIIWSDASGDTCSMFHEWADLKALTGYVHSLYIPPPAHFTVDPTIGRSPLAGEETHMDCPLWDVAFDGTTHERCAVVYLGRACWVARSNAGVIIKDSYVSDSTIWTEAGLLQTLHKDGYVEGWVQYSACGEVKISGKAIKTRNGRRTKIRMVMEARGESLYLCSSVLHFLKVMYDVLEGRS